MKLKLSPFKYIVPLLMLLNGCSKDFLNKKPNSSIVVPSTLNDFQELLDNYLTINLFPTLGHLSDDEYYVPDYGAWVGRTFPVEQNAYIWAKDLYSGETNIPDWNASYQQVFNANVVLEGLASVKKDSVNIQQWNYIKGWALFVRAFAFYNLAETFCEPYDSSTLSSNLGIPLKLKAEVDETEPRSTLKQTYDQIFEDLSTAGSLLINGVPSSNENRPSKPAYYALMARIFLSIRDYGKAELYADSSLSLYNTLIDYNTIDTTTTQPFNYNNTETIYYAVQNAWPTMARQSTIIAIDTTLYGSYTSNDLRKEIFFIRNSNGTISKKRGYEGGGNYPYAGLAVDEMYLIKAECMARKGQAQGAMDVLNSLLKYRWVTNTYQPYTANNSTDALSIILNERKKELVWRNLRWSDLRRLNKEGANITLTRIFNGQTYTLSPNSPLYTFPIPDDEIAASGIEQNQR